MIVNVEGKSRSYRTVSFNSQRNAVLLIEQRLLPHQFKVVSFHTYQDTARAIREMVVRGAGAIAATAAYGLAQGARAYKGQNLEDFERHVEEVYQTIKAARPTAIDPVNAMLALRKCLKSDQSIEFQQDAALQFAEKFADQNVAECRAIGRYGESLIRDGMRILTHCNAGWLAFVDVGSATAPLYEAQAQDRRFHVFCDETRPRSQGAALTAWELAQQGISHQIISDNAAGHLMQRGEIDMVIVGSDRILGRTGEVANKIGTYTKAVLAAHHGLPFYVAIPLSTLDWQLSSGMDIPIEERSEDEVLGAWGMSGKKRAYVRVANPSSKARNPSFDVTPAELITGIITPKGIFKPGELQNHFQQLQPED